MQSSFTDDWCAKNGRYFLFSKTDCSYPRIYSLRWALKKKIFCCRQNIYLVMILFTFFFFFPLLECNVFVRSVQHHNSEIRIPKHHDRAILFFIGLSTSKNNLRMVGPQRSRSLSSVFFQNLLCVWICFSFVKIYWLGFWAKGTALTTRHKLLKKRGNSLAFLVMGLRYVSSEKPN